MLAMGGERGLALALAVELFAVALTGAAFGFEADSFFQPTGNRPRLGQLLLAVDPQALAGEAYAARIATLEAVAEADGVRLPGARRTTMADAAARDGIAVPDALWAEITARAGLDATGGVG
jgi:(2R)-3-sulfolactate dehydrogenase (NADP+)